MALSCDQTKRSVKIHGPQRMRGATFGPKCGTTADSDAPRVNSGPNKVRIRVQDLLALLDIGYGVDLISLKLRQGDALCWSVIYVDCALMFSRNVLAYLQHVRRDLQVIDKESRLMKSQKCSLLRKKLGS